jgi:hypothetical protein|tara:strand:- start:342 stop:536 length:195 start_codon:yes stop_codon:yes gene_type:complete
MKSKLFEFFGGPRSDIVKLFGMYLSVDDVGDDDGLVRPVTEDLDHEYGEGMYDDDLETVGCFGS